MKKILLLFAAAFFVLGFSGCSAFETDTEVLMQPPSLTEEQAKLNDALTGVTGGDFYLKYPLNNGSNSAFMFCDLDNDGSEEALAFYSAGDDSSGTRINILRQSGGDWVSVYEAAGSSGDISDVHFLDTGKEKLLVVKWDKEIGIYDFVSDRLEQLYMSPCDGIELADMNGDGVLDVIVFGGSYDNRFTARILYSSGDGMEISEAVYINAEYANIYSTAVGGLGDGRTGFFVDSKIYDNIYLTEVLVLEGERTLRYTIASFIVEEEEESSGTGFIISKRGMYARNTAAVCTDIDGDGIIEMPVEIREDTVTTDSYDESRIYFIEYVKYDGADALPVWYGFANGEDGYVFRLEQEWSSGVLIKYSQNFDEYAFIDIEKGEEVLSIRSVRAGAYQDIYEGDEVLAGKNGTKAFYVTVRAKEGDSYYISPESCKERFTFVK